MTHQAKVLFRLSRSSRVRLGVLVLALLSLPAIFAELVAADVPIVAVGAAGVVILPAIVEPSAHRDVTADEIADLYRGDHAVWPIVRHGPDTESARGPLAEPSFEHPFGTDAHGRDVFARLVYGARAALGLAFVALVLALTFGILFGALAGYVGGFWDELLARPVEVIQTFPAIVVVAVARAIDPDGSVWSLALALSFVRWAEIARLVRAEVMRLSSEEFVHAARALGAGHVRILYRHILPQALRPLVVSSLFAVPSVVLLEAAVAFLGIGHEGSWGALLAQGLSAGNTSAAALAAAAIAMTVLAAHALADAASEALDARVAAHATVRGRGAGP